MELNFEEIYNHFQSWEKIDEFEDQIKIGGKIIYLSGVAWKNSDEKIVSGSAASDLFPPQKRAHFELLERIIMIESQKEESFPLSDIHGNSLGVISRDLVFPQSDNQDRYRYSLSNGVAFHTDPNLAREKAKLELIERDRILRSWFGGKKPRPLILPNRFNESFSLLSQIYEIKAFYFFPDESQINSDVSVVGIFAYPLDPTSPLVYGLGAHQSLEQAINHAWDESLQRMGFLYGEEKNPDLTQFSPTALYHQDYFLNKEGEEKISQWLLRGNSLDLNFPLSHSEQITFAEITPAPLRETAISVFRAISPNHIPLIFGKNYPILGLAIPEKWQIHPVV